MVRQHHPLNRHEFEPTLGDREGQGGLACCSPWGCKESDMTERLSNNKCLLIIFYQRITQQKRKLHHRNCFQVQQQALTSPKKSSGQLLACLQVDKGISCPQTWRSSQHLSQSELKGFSRALKREGFPLICFQVPDPHVISHSVPMTGRIRRYLVKRN